MRTRFLCRFLPYCLQRQEDGSYLVLNREYQPLGLERGQLSEVGRKGSTVKIERLGTAVAEGLSYQEESQLYLYGADCFPPDSPENWDAFCQKLRLLGGLVVDTAPRRSRG